MEYFTEFLDALIELSNAMAPYILFGLLFAGIMHELISEDIVKNHLGKSSFYSVVKAALFGAPLPVCSCGVIPLAAGLKKSGASNGSVLSFLISTPITGVDSILATYGMFGWVFTIYRVFSSLLIAIVAGVLSNIYDKQESLVAKEEPTQSCCSSSCCSSHPQEEKKSFSFTRAYRYGFVTLLGDIAASLIVGLLIGALITVLVPQNLGEILTSYWWLSYIIAILIAVPMYVCATSSLPIAAGLMIAGVSPGAAFVFLSAGPATNTVTIGVVKQMLGKRTLFIYLATIILGSVVFGLGLDYFLGEIEIKELIKMDESFGIVAILSSVVLWTLALYFVLKSWFAKKKV